MKNPDQKSKLQRYAVLILLAAGLLAAIILTLSERWTRAQIAANQAAYALRMVTEVLPAGSYDNEPGKDVIMLSYPDLPGSIEPLPAYRARAGGQVIATAITAVADDGYVGPIGLLIGIDDGGSIIRVRVLDHRETPGLGDKIETDKSDWIHLLEGKTASEDPNASEWLLRRDGGDIDQISGATITSRAILRTVRQTQRFYLENTARIHAAGNPESNN
ncbi:MAG: RnfABCDGE type electron transport complex subunit G [Gammaproteobacteria bacterium]